MNAAVDNFQRMKPSWVPDDLEAHIAECLCRAKALQILEIGSYDLDRARVVRESGGKYLCLLPHSCDAVALEGTDAEVVRDDPDWWCGGMRAAIDAAVILDVTRLLRLDQLLEVVWHELRSGALLVLAGECVARPEPPEGSTVLRTVAELHTSLVLSGFAVVSITDTTGGVVLVARRI